jgi:hypothetical protein
MVVEFARRFVESVELDPRTTLLGVVLGVGLIILLVARELGPILRPEARDVARRMDPAIVGLTVGLATIVIGRTLAIFQ